MSQYVAWLGVQPRPPRTGLAYVAVRVAVYLIGLVAMVLVARRARRRRTRTYALYDLHLSTHDQAKGQDLEDMVESIANIVRAWPADRARHGQPYFALALICGGSAHPGGGQEMEWSINDPCHPEDVIALDGAISAAYPDVRLGRTHGEQPRPRAGVLREPGYLMRFRKERSFVYSLIADGAEQRIGRGDCRGAGGRVGGHRGACGTRPGHGSTTEPAPPCAAHHLSRRLPNGISL